MAEEDRFLRSVPGFLRRPQEPVPEVPRFMTPTGAIAPAPSSVPAAVLAPPQALARRPGSLVSPPAAAGSRRLGPDAPTAIPAAVVRFAPPGAEPAPTQARAGADFFAEARSGIENLLARHGEDAANEEDDTAFQVTLPRGVVRQIRILAAQEGTTQRAVVLKALRLAGLAVPEGADIDRRILAGRRRQQA